jgi:hypothetical protein
MHLTLIRDMTVDTPLPSGHAFLSAASGMVVRGSMLYAVADDAHCLAVFDLEGSAPGRLIPLIAEDLPKNAVQRKRQKPDFEILLALPDDRMLALGSGSTPQRMRGAVIELPTNGEPASVRLIDLRPLFAALTPLVPEVNLEGAVLQGEELLLFNRGTMAYPTSHIVGVPLAAVLAGEAMLAALRATLMLPLCAGVPLTATDAYRLESGRILLSAVAEHTADTYADGALVGAAIVELNADFTVSAVELLEPMLKVEGLSARIEADGVHLMCVTDADDPERVAGVYRGKLGGA